MEVDLCSSTGLTLTKISHNWCRKAWPWSQCYFWLDVLVRLSTISWICNLNIWVFLVKCKSLLVIFINPVHYITIKLRELSASTATHWERTLMLVILGERSRVTFSFENKMHNYCCQVKGQGLCKLWVMRSRSTNQMTDLGHMTTN